MAKQKDENFFLEIQELKEKGFVKSSQRLLYYIRTRGYPNIKIFRTGITAGSGRKGTTKYSSIDIFGDHHNYCYDINRKKEFVDFLVRKFYTNNDNPDMNIRKVFSRMLHAHGLHWDECACKKKDDGDVDENIDDVV